MTDGREPRSERVLIVGAGVVGLCAAYYARRQGFDVTVVEREGPARATTSFGNAGFVVPSHFVPLAAPGVVAQGIRWMFDPESPFYVRPALDPALAAWGYRFWRASTAEHVQRSGPLLMALNRASSARYRELADAIGDVFDLQQRGLLMLCATEAGLEHEAATAEQARRLGMRAEVVRRDALGDLEPDVDLAVVGATYYPEDACLDPGRFMRALQAALEADGVRFLWNTEVAALDSEGGRVRGARLVRASGTTAPGTASLGPTYGSPTQGRPDEHRATEAAAARAAATVPTAAATVPAAGAAATRAATAAVTAAATAAATGAATAAPTAHTDRLTFDAVVLAAGVWSPGLTRSLGVRLPMRAGKGYSVTLPDPARSLSRPVLLSEAHVAITPLAGALRFGGTMEVTSAPRGGAGNAGPSLSPGARRRVRGILRAVERYLPAYPVSALAQLPVWFGYRPTSPDGLPFLGRLTRHPNVIVATGHAMMGMSLGPVTGAVVAELLANAPASVPLEALRPDRFMRAR